MTYFKPSEDCNRVEYKGQHVLQMGDEWNVKEIWVYDDYEVPMIKLTVEPKPKKTTIKVIEV